MFENVMMICEYNVRTSVLIENEYDTYANSYATHALGGTWKYMSPT